MGIWILILVCDLFVPVIMIVSGYLMDRHSPKKINHICGYRTRRSMMNTDTWSFANQLCGKLWMRIGALLFVLTVLIHLLFLHGSEDALAILCVTVESVQVVTMLVSVYFVERALKRCFTENGRRKQVPE